MSYSQTQIAEPNIERTVLTVVIPNNTLKAKQAEAKDVPTKEQASSTPVENEVQEQKIHKRYRSQKRTGGAVEAPKQLTTITASEYKNAIGFQQTGQDKAYLQPCIEPIDDIQELKYDPGEGQLMMRGFPLSAAVVKDFALNKIPEDLDLPFLQFLYSIIWQAFKMQFIQEGNRNFIEIRDIGVYYPQIARALGKPHHVSREDEEKFIKKLHSYNSIIGYVNGKYQPILVFTGEDREQNGLIYFQSPYLMQVIYDLYKASIRTTKDNKPKLTSSGQPDLKPAHSTLINSSLVKERNKSAACNVQEIIYTIENAGKNVPHIKARTLIDRNPQLKARIESTEELRYKNRLLKRVFSATWELLRTQTRLTEVYKDIQLPDPKDQSVIPTMTTLDMVFQFPHKGKIKQVNEISDK